MGMAWRARSGGGGGGSLRDTERGEERRGEGHGAQRGERESTRARARRGAQHSGGWPEWVPRGARPQLTERGGGGRVSTRRNNAQHGTRPSRRGPVDAHSAAAQAEAAGGRQAAGDWHAAGQANRRRDSAHRTAAAAACGLPLPLTRTGAGRTRMQLLASYTATAHAACCCCCCSCSRRPVQQRRVFLKFVGPRGARPPNKL